MENTALNPLEASAQFDCTKIPFHSWHASAMKYIGRGAVISYHARQERLVVTGAPDVIADAHTDFARLNQLYA